MGSREKVLEIAARTFGRNGYRTTSVDEILSAAKVSPSNFYYHFASKEELASEVLERYFDAYRRQIGPILMNRKLSPAAKLERLQEFFVETMSSNGCCGGCPIGNLAQELSDVHPAFRRRLAEFFEECLESIAQVIRQGKRAGTFRKDLDPDAAAYLLFGSIEGLVLLSKSLKKTAPMTRGFRQILALMRD